MTTFPYRAELTQRELVPALVAGAAAGAVIAYIAQNFLRRRELASGAPAPASMPRG